MEKTKLINTLLSLEDKYTSRDCIYALFIFKNLPLKIKDHSTAPKSKNELIDYIKGLQKILSVNFINIKDLRQFDCLNLWEETPNCDAKTYDHLIEHALENFLIKQNKNLSGSFYTPPQIAEMMIKKANCDLNNKKILDPACGAGVFLKACLNSLQASPSKRKNFIENSLFGIDLNPIAIETTKLLLSLKCFDAIDKIIDPKQFPNLEENFLCQNSLLPLDTNSALTWDNYYFSQYNFKGFDLILSNPPFGLSRNEQISITEKQLLKKIYRDVCPGKPNKYMLFMTMISKLLSNQGQALIISPNSWLGIKDAKLLREQLLDNYLFSISSFKQKIFPKLGVETLITHLKKSKHKKITLEMCDLDSKEVSRSTISTEQIKQSPDFIIPSFWNDDYNSIFDLLAKNCRTIAQFKNQFKPLIALQVYSQNKGDPPQNINIVKSHAFHSTKKKNKNYLPYLKGRDLQAFKINWSGKYLHYGKWIAEHQPIERYQQQRILVREILSPLPYLTQSVFTDQTYCYNRSILHILCDKDLPRSTGIALSNILNSEFASFYFFIKGRKSQRKIFPKLVLDDLKDFPLPINFLKKHEGLGVEITSPENLSQRQSLDNLVYKHYGLSAKQIKSIKNTVNNL